MSAVRPSAILALLAVAVAFLQGSADLAVGQVEPSAEYVVVQRATAPGIERQIEGPPTLAELGHDVLPVPAGRTAADYAAELESRPEYRSAQPDARVRAAAVPNDTYYARDQAGYYSSIDAPEAWDLAVGREEVVVAILDSGADLSHPDLAPRLWVNDAELPNNGIDDDGNGCVDDVHGCRFTMVTPESQALCNYGPNDALATGDVWDDNGRLPLAPSAQHSHGTMVAGAVGAAGNNGVGVTGVAWNVRLMIVKVLDCGTPSGGTPSGWMSDVAAGIEYARRMGADVVNLSLASDPNDLNADQPGLRDAIRAARDEGVLIVTAAGNFGSGSNPQPGYPAAYAQFSNVIAVGASDWRNNNTWAAYSSFGPAVDFAAPGNGITSTVRTDLGLAVPYGKAEQGTSFSTPLVTGTFALMIGRNSQLSHETYIDLARQGATPAIPAPHGQPWAGAGILNVRGAVERIPMRITGAAQHDWIDVPADTLVEARIAGVLCGETLTSALGPVSRFELFVSPQAVVPGCGDPGREVELYIAGQEGVPTFPWGNATQELLYAGEEVTSVTPPPGPLVIQQLVPGWNNVAHLTASGSPPGAVAYLPTAWNAIYLWEAFEGRYLRWVKDLPAYVQDLLTIDQFDAYWVYTDTASNAASVNPQPEPGRTVYLGRGWNNVVYTGASREVTSALDEIAGRYTAVYRYDNPTTTWQSYIPDRAEAFNTVGGLLTMQVYWIYMTEPASITLD